MKTQVNAQDVTNYFMQKGISWTEAAGGKEAVVDCIYCGKEDHMYVCLQPSTQKKAKTSYGIRPGHHHCKVCGGKGTWAKLLRSKGDLPNISKISNSVKSGKFNRKHDVYRPVDNVRPDEGSDTAYHDHLVWALSDECDDPNVLDAWGYLTEERCLTREVLERAKVGFCYRKLNVNKSKRGGDYQDIPCLTFPYYDEKGKLINIKFRSVNKVKVTNKSGKTKEKRIYIRWTGCASTPYGLETLDKELPYVAIVEGEIDKLSMEVYGYSNILSVPNGASSWEHWWNQYVSDFEEVLTICDNEEDGPGQDGAKNIAEKVGKVRCRNVLLPLKDANACLQAGVTLEELQEHIDNAEAFPGCEIFEARDLKDALLKRLRGGEETVGYSTGDPQLDALIGGWRPKEVTILTGDTSTGKTTYLLYLLLKLARTGKGVMIANFEMPPIDMAMKLLTLIARKSFILLTEDEFEAAFAELDQLPIYYMNAGSSSDLEEIEETIEYAARYLGIFMFALDPLQKAIQVDETNFSMERLLYIKAVEMMQRLVFAYSIHIIVIIHPNQLKGDNKQIRKVVLGDLPQSARIKQDLANCLRVWVEQDDADLLTPNVEVALIMRRSDFARLGVAFYEFDISCNDYRRREQGQSALAKPKYQRGNFSKRRRTKKETESPEVSEKTQERKDLFE